MARLACAAVIYEADPRCWFCPDGKAVQQNQPLCRDCQRQALERLRRFLANSRVAAAVGPATDGVG
jgi:hypothetical protein